jgi:hypothetical protein
VTDGVTGFVVDTVDEATAAVGRVAALSRRACRREFERRFDAARMARDYLEVYRRLAAGEPSHARGVGGRAIPLSSDRGPEAVPPHRLAAGVLGPVL